MTSRPSNLIKLAKDVYLARPLSSSAAASAVTSAIDSGNSASTSSAGTSKTQPKCIVLLGWMDAQLKHLEKYAQGYHQQFPRASIVLVQTHQTAFYSRQSALRANLAPVVEHLKAEYPDAKAGPTSPILIHTFSNGGCFAIKTIDEMMSIKNRRSSNGKEETTALLNGESDNGSHSGVPARALVFDSCPGTSNLIIMIRAFTAPIRRWWLKWPASGLVALMYLFIRASDFLRAQPNAIDRISNYLSSNLPPVPRLYLYSQTDLLIPPKSVEAHAARAKRAGISSVEMVDFGKSAHVSHARTDPTRYWDAVRRVWEQSGEHAASH